MVDKMHVACVFRRPVFYSDSLVAMRAGPLVHVELMPLDPSTPENSMSYTSYVGYPFAASLSTKHTFDNATCVALALEVERPEFERLVGYLHDLCERNIPYNYGDTALMMLPLQLVQSLCDDVPSESPEHITTLFCSQAVVLALRHALSEEHPAFRLVRDINSRTVFPYALFQLLRPYTRPVCCNALQRGAFVPRSLTESL